MSEFAKYEKKWQKRWKKDKIFEVDPDPKKKKFFLTVPYPYTNGALHIGHGRTYTVGDLIARWKRMQGFNVLYQKLGITRGMWSCQQASGEYYGKKFPGAWLPAFSFSDQPLKPDKLVDLFSAWPVHDVFENKVLGETAAEVFKDMEAFDYTNPAAYRGY